MTAVLLGLAYNKPEIIDYWGHPFSQDAVDRNNNADTLNEKSLIRLSNNCLDSNYKTKRMRLAENKLKEKLNVQPVQLSARILPVANKLELLSSVMNLTDFNLTAQLGKGSFGTVFAAEYVDSQRQSKRKVALKIIQTHTSNKYKEQLKNSFLAELNAKGLKHQNIVSHLGFNECDFFTKNAFVIYELCGTMNLKQFLLDETKTLSISKRKTMSMDLVRAIEYCHLNNIVHMDIKPANIIVTNNLICKLTDFGCSVRLNKQQLFGEDRQINSTLNLKGQYEDNRWTAGTWFYRAPELFRGDKTFFQRNQDLVTVKCDIYSLGIVMWQLLTRESPYQQYHEDPQVIVYQIVSKNLRPHFPVTEPPADANKILSPRLIASKSSNSLLQLSSSCDKIQIMDYSAKLNPDMLAHSRSVSNLNAKSKPDNSEFERVFRNLIEVSWSNDPERRYEAKTLKEILQNTKISY